MRAALAVLVFFVLLAPRANVSFCDEPSGPAKDELLEKIVDSNVSLSDLQRWKGNLNFRFNASNVEGNFQVLGNGDKWTPLTAAIRTGQFELAILLLCSGADATYATHRGYSPIWLLSASPLGNTDEAGFLASALLVAGADVLASPTRISAPPSDVTAIHMAGRMGNANLLTVFQTAGIGFGVHDSSGRSPLEYANSSTEAAKRRDLGRLQDFNRTIAILKASPGSDSQFGIQPESTDKTEVSRVNNESEGGD